MRSAARGQVWPGLRGANSGELPEHSSEWLNIKPVRQMAVFGKFFFFSVMCRCRKKKSGYGV